MKPYEVDELAREVRRLADEVAQIHSGREVAFAEQRAAEQAVMLELLDAMRAAFPWLAEVRTDVRGLPGDGSYWMVPIDAVGDHEWFACDHPELGLVIALWPLEEDPRRVWPGGELPSGREGGPRLTKVLERLIGKLANQATGNGARRRREAEQLAHRLRAVQTLLRAP